MYRAQSRNDQSLKEKYQLQAEGHQHKAEKELSQSVKNIDPTDPYPVLWLYLVRKHARMTLPLAELTRVSDYLERRLNPADPWPRPIVRLFLESENQGRSDSLSVIKEAKNDDNRCEAHYYVGEWYIFQNELVKAKSEFEDAEKKCPRTYLERFAAHAYLLRFQEETRR